MRGWLWLWQPALCIAPAPIFTVFLFCPTNTLHLCFIWNSTFLPMNAFTIKDLEKLSGIKAHTIRIWEQRYGFLKPQRTDTNIRFYTGDELRTLLNVSLLNKAGFKISHISRMDEKEMSEKIAALPQSQAQQERIINELITHMVKLELDGFETLLDNYMASRGTEKTITQIIFPFLERIGVLWLTNHINPAQEHLVSNIIRQKLILGIENVRSHIQTGKKVILFLPEGEYHELALLFVHYLLKSRGTQIWYLGCDTPLKDLAFLANTVQPAFVYTHLTSLPNNQGTEKFFEGYTAHMENIALVASGQLVQEYKKKLPPHIHLKKTLAEVLEHIAAL